MKVKELLRLAILYAIQDRKTFLECINSYQESSKQEDRDYYESQKNLIAEFYAYHHRRWGKTPEEKLSENQKTMSMEEFLNNDSHSSRPEH